MKGSRLFIAGLLAVAAFATTNAIAQQNGDANADRGHGNPGNGRCALHSDNNRIQHVVYIQFDNVHFRRDIPNVPSDLEQMPNLRNFLVDNGSVLTDHHTPLISHTSVDILTTLTGVYGEKMGAPIGNSLPFFKPTGTAAFPSTFEYWTDNLETTPVPVPVMVNQQGKIHPAPWVPFTRAGCDVGAFSVANIEFENITNDLINVFGAGSPEAMEASSNPTKAKADFLGIAVHCAQSSPVCAKGKPDVLMDEPGGYQGFNALFGGVNVQPAVSPQGPVKDIDGNVIADASGNPGFPNTFNPSASQTLGYLATMLEAGIPVVYGYVEDMHDNHAGGGTFGPGEAGYVAQLAAANEAFGKFFARLAQDGITKDNTLFIVTADENDQLRRRRTLPRQLRRRACGLHVSADRRDRCESQPSAGDASQQYHAVFGALGLRTHLLHQRQSGPNRSDHPAAGTRHGRIDGRQSDHGQHRQDRPGDGGYNRAALPAHGDLGSESNA